MTLIAGFLSLWSQILADLAQLGSAGALLAFATVIILDVALAGDNAIVIGALAARLSPPDRRRVIALGTLAALVLRLMFAIAILYGLDQFKHYGLVFGGGLLLLWVAWKMFRELDPRGAGAEAGATPAIVGASGFARAVWAIALADVSMSLDNVLAVAGAAKDHPGILLIGLTLSVVLMGFASNALAAWIERYRWIGWFGLAVVVAVAVRMMIEGWHDMAPLLGSMTGATIGGTR